ETRLAEDLQFKDADKVKLDWIPPNSPLTYAGWFTVKNRAQTRAVPPLNTASSPAVDKCFKALDKETGADDTAKARQLACAKELVKQLKLYKPQSTDNSPHEEMLTVARTF